MRAYMRPSGDMAPIAWLFLMGASGPLRTLRSVMLKMVTSRDPCGHKPCFNQALHLMLDTALRQIQQEPLLQGLLQDEYGAAIIPN